MADARSGRLANDLRRWWMRRLACGCDGRSVELTVFDAKGQRHTIKARAGQRLNDALLQNKDQLGEDFEFQSPVGCVEMDCHVSVANEWLERLPQPSEDERKVIRECVERPDKHSRLGSQIVLCKDMHQMVIALGAAQPWQTL